MSLLALGTGILGSRRRGPAETIIVNDTFTDTDGVLLTAHTSDSGHAWTKVAFGGGTSTITITTNQAKVTANTGTSFHVVTSGVSDCTVQVPVPADPSGGTGLVLRLADGSNFLMWQASGTVAKVVAGSQTTVTTGASYSAGSTIKAVMLGSSLQFYVNGILKASATETAGQTNTKHGIRAANTVNAIYDNFIVETP